MTNWIHSYYTYHQNTISQPCYSPGDLPVLSPCCTVDSTCGTTMPSWVGTYMTIRTPTGGFFSHRNRRHWETKVLTSSSKTRKFRGKFYMFLHLKKRTGEIFPQKRSGSQQKVDTFTSSGLLDNSQKTLNNWPIKIIIACCCFLTSLLLKMSGFLWVQKGQLGEESNLSLGNLKEDVHEPFIKFVIPKCWYAFRFVKGDRIYRPPRLCEDVDRRTVVWSNHVVLSIEQRSLKATNHCNSICI